jgi:hypothetical protein
MKIENYSNEGTCTGMKFACLVLKSGLLSNIITSSGERVNVGGGGPQVGERNLKRAKTGKSTL